MFLLLACLILARRYGTSATSGASLADPLTYDVLISARDECSYYCPCLGRSVWDIVWSCLATTFSVTWVSVHPNVPYLGESSWSLLKRRIFLMCLALLAPEAMIIWAFKQWRGALMIKDAINKARPESCHGVHWTMMHAHFLQMGGFKVNCLEEEDNGFLASYSRCYNIKKGAVVESVICFGQFSELLQKQRIDFPDTTAEEIEDRSKGDALSKGIALLQISWFIVQLIARVHQHLTITEIELTTAALAGLNSIMYLFWWSKPLDVRCPIVIKTKELEKKLVEKGRNAGNSENKLQNEGSSDGVTGRVCSRSADKWLFTGKQFQLKDYLRQSIQAIILTLARYPLSLAKWFVEMVCVLCRLIPQRTETVDEPQSSTDQSPVTKLHFRRAIKWIWTTYKLSVTKLLYLLNVAMFTPMGQILYSFAPLNFDLDEFADAKDKIHSKPALSMLFNEPDMRWIMSMMFYSEHTERRPLVIFYALTGAAFGSIHCAAWHFHFPSLVEQTLWRTASMTIVGLSLCLSIIAVSRIYEHYVYVKWLRTVSGTPEHIFRTRIKKTVELPPVITYSVARLSILILALLSLRRLPPSAFDSVDWTKVQICGITFVQSTESNAEGGRRRRDRRASIRIDSRATE